MEGMSFIKCFRLIVEYAQGEQMKIFYIVYDEKNKTYYTSKYEADISLFLVERQEWATIVMKANLHILKEIQKVLCPQKEMFD